ncbi:leucine--tRNA ligase [Candidatus Woesearchaeota archaeon]|nr:leucine--tRNA ligase [Candidatus Woesearchaeota archaeon]
MTTLETKWQKKCEEAKIFEVDSDMKKKKFFITIPYPYISGSLHIGHARVVTEADVYSRYYRMNNYNVLFPIAFHISGMPVLGIATAIKNKDTKKIELYKAYVKNYVADSKKAEKIVASFEDPRKIVDFFIPKMKDEFSSLGIAVDWRRSFTSGDFEHQKLVEWQFKKYKEKGYLVQGKHPVLYSLEYKNAVGEDDIADGDIYPVDKQEFTLLKFKFDDAFIIAATLRPETMYGQTNMWANPEADYVKAEIGKEKWIISRECAEKLKYQDKEVKILKTISGKDLIGKKCLAPVVEKKVLILPFKKANPNIATGFVTSVPSDAPFDYIGLKELQSSPALCKKYNLDYREIKNIKLIPIIKSKGYGDHPAKEICEKNKISSLAQEKELSEATQEIYCAGFHTGIMQDNCKQYAGMSVQQAKEEIKTNLIKKGIADIFYETSRPAVDRSSGKIIVAILDNQWFIDFNAKNWKQTAHNCLENMEIVPNKYKKQFEDVFAWLDKRPCARRRGLGTKLPFDKNWVIESLSDSTIYMSLYAIANKIKKFKLKEEQLNNEFFNYVYLSEGGLKEAVKKTKISEKQLKELREEFDYWYPNDHRHTFTAHLANHLSFMIFAHAAIFPKEKWPKKITFHGMVISEGEKMSKSKGNTVSLLDIKNKFGADSFRAFMCNSTSVESTFDWKTAEIEHMKKHVELLYNMLIGLSKNKSPGDVGEKAKAFVSKIEKKTQKATEAISQMDLRTYSTIVLHELLTEYKQVSKKLDENEIKKVNNYLLEKWLKLLTPLIPHHAEEIWSRLGKKGFISLEKWPESDVSKINPVAEYQENLVNDLIIDIKTVMNLAKIPNAKTIKIIISADWKYHFFAMLKELLEKTRDQGSIIKSIMSTNLKKYGNEIMKMLPSLLKDPSKIPIIILDQKTELQSIETVKKDIETEFRTSVILELCEESKEPKAKQSNPGKPAIVVT